MLQNVIMELNTCFRNISWSHVGCRWTQNFSYEYVVCCWGKMGL